VGLALTAEQDKAVKRAGGEKDAPRQAADKEKARDGQPGRQIRGVIKSIAPDKGVLIIAGGENQARELEVKLAGLKITAGDRELKPGDLKVGDPVTLVGDPAARDFKQLIVNRRDQKKPEGRDQPPAGKPGDRPVDKKPEGGARPADPPEAAHQPEATVRKTGTTFGMITAKKEAPNGKVVRIEVKALGDESSHGYHAWNNPAVVELVRSAAVGDLVRFNWESGPT
jgi:hypothetical protein